MDRHVNDFLVNTVRVPKASLGRLISKLEDLGIECMKDFEDLKADDISDSSLGLSEILQRRLIRCVKEYFSPQASSPPNMPLEYVSPPPLSPFVQPTSVKSNKIYYFLCTKELFVRSIPREVVSNLDLERDSLESIVKTISQRHKYPLEKFAFEFYSHEGYPLGVNKYNQKFTFSQWKLVNESVLYVMIRPLTQITWIDETCTVDTNADPKSGPACVQVYSQLYPIFKVNINPQNDDLSCLKKKIGLCIGLPSKYFTLYRRAVGYEKLKHDELLDFNDNDCVILRIEGYVPESLSSLTPKKSLYTPCVIQTDRGYAKFYTILKYLICSKATHESYLKQFVTAVLNFTSFPPLAYAFHQLFQHQSIMSLSHMTVLFEGFFQLSTAILGYFCNNIQPEKCFEFCDYVFGLMLKLSKAVRDTGKVSMEKVHLICPITGRQILHPVNVPKSSLAYERIVAQEKIKDGLGLVHCTNHDLKLADIRPAQTVERFLMFNAFSDHPGASILDFEIWSTLPLDNRQREISPVMISCTWKDLDAAIGMLQIQSPDALSSKYYCITYIEKGQFAFHTEPNKAAEMKKNIYDPITGTDIPYEKSVLEGFAREWKTEACHKLSNYLNPKIKAGSVSSADLLKSVCAICEKQDPTEIIGDPEEAIMVLVDCSGSMSENFNASDSSSISYSKLTAAKELFFAFANRTDAYGFNHVIGLTTFASEVTIKVEFTQIIDYFKNFVIGMDHAAGRTALHNALSVAADALLKLTKKYPHCHKRILCLTDGENNVSGIDGWEIAQRLQKEKIVADTVLITSLGNGEQKAISHASGGFCFLPSNLQEATRLFEMEILLRIQDRSTPYPKRNAVETKKDFEMFKDFAKSYDKTNPFEFRTNFAADMDNLVSYSAKRMVNLATFMGQSSNSSSTSSRDCVRRVILEAKNYIADSHPCVNVFPGQSNVLMWKILLKGPDDCPYAGGVFLLLAKFPNEYPVKPPVIRFVTPIYHCNINSSGRICHPILGRNYVPSMSIRSIIDHIYGLLMVPEPLDPLDSILASQYHDSRAVYEEKAAEHTEKYAKKFGWDELQKELTNDEDLDVAEGLVCPLTNKLFVDPVFTPFGFTYERTALLEYMKNNGNKDPKAQKPIQVTNLIPQRSIKQLADELRASNFSLNK